MAYHKRTLRKMLPVTRKLARLTGEAGSLERRMKALVEEIQHLELGSRAFDKQRLIHQVDQEINIEEFNEQNRGTRENATHYEPGSEAD